MKETLLTIDWVNVYKEVQSALETGHVIIRDGVAYWHAMSGKSGIAQHLPLKEVVLELRDQGKTILFSTHRMEQVEQMCDEICLFNKGRAVLKGNLRDIKQSFGKNTINLEFEGNAGFLDTLKNVRINNRSNNFAEIRVLDGQNMQDILKTAMAHAEIYKFERIEPSLQEIFISTVGEDNINPKDLGQ